MTSKRRYGILFRGPYQRVTVTQEKIHVEQAEEQGPPGPSRYQEGPAQEHLAQHRRRGRAGHGDGRRAHARPQLAQAVDAEAQPRPADQAGQADPGQASAGGGRVPCPDRRGQHEGQVGEVGQDQLQLIRFLYLRWAVHIARPIGFYHKQKKPVWGFLFY